MRIAAFLALLALSACARKAEPSAAPAPTGQTEKAAEPAAAAAEAKPAAPAAPVEIKGRRIDIKATEKGYVPNRVEVGAGEEVTLVFTRTIKSHCLAEIMVPSISVKKELPLDQPVAIHFTPTRYGEVPFSCGMDMVHGTIVVK